MQTEEYFIKVAFITNARLWCPFSCHFSISRSSYLSLCLFSFPLTLCLLSASYLSVSLCHFSISSAAISHFHVPLSLIFSPPLLIYFCCWAVLWRTAVAIYGGEGSGTGSGVHHDVDSLSPNSPLEAKQQLQNSPCSHCLSPLTCSLGFFLTLRS